MQIISMKLADIKPYEKNPRKNDEAVKYVVESIREFGFKVPIVIDKDNVIVAGHTRYKAAKRIEMDEVPCIIADDLTDAQIKAYRLADNKVAEKADWDFDILSGELEDLVNLDFDMTLYGFGEVQIEPINDEELEETQAIEYKMTFGKTTVILTDDEYEDLQDAFKEYTSENGVSFGFVRWLLHER